MGFWDREVRSSFDSVFDYDRDGYLNTSEQTMQFSYIEDCEKSENDDMDDDIFDDYHSGAFGSDTYNRNKDDLFGLENDRDEFDLDF